MLDFLEFNVSRFLKESKGWTKEIQTLKARLESVPEIKGIDNSPIRSGRLHDSVHDVVSEREHIQEQIDKISTYQDALSYARKRLTEEQNEVIDAFFFAGGYIGKNVKAAAKKYGVRERGVYEIKREALAIMRQAIEEKYL